MRIRKCSISLPTAFRLLSLWLLFCTPFLNTLSAQETSFDPEYRFSKRELKADLKLLQKVLEEAHPGLYRYTSKATIDATFERSYAEIKKGGTYLDFFRIAKRIITQVSCIHSNVGHSKAYKKYRNENLTFFPFQLRAVQGRIYIHHNNSLNQEIQPGAEVRSINGMDWPTIKAKIAPSTPTDGENQSLIAHNVAEYLSHGWGNFIGFPDSFALEIIQPENGITHANGAITTIKVAALPKAKLDSVHQIWRTPAPYELIDQAPPLPLAYQILKEKRTAVLTIQSFRNELLEYRRQSFSPFMKQFFGAIDSADIEHLVIDLRNNGGGWTANGKELFGYLIESPTPYVKQVVVSKNEGFSFEKHLTYPSGLQQDTMVFVNNAEGELIWQNYPNLIAEPAPHHRFKGKVYILGNGKTISCGAVFTALCKSHGRATFFGEEIGGAYPGPSGSPLGVLLPHTQIPINISTTRYELAVKPDGNRGGVMPTQTLEFPDPNYTLGKDPELQALFRLIWEK